MINYLPLGGGEVSRLGGNWAIDIPKLGEQVLYDARLETHIGGQLWGKAALHVQHCRIV